MQYHALVAGLPDIQLDDTKIVYTVFDFKFQLDEILSKSDKELINSLFLKYDNDNLLAFLKNKDADFDPRGIFSKEEIADMVQEIREVEKPLNKQIPPYFKLFLDDYFSGQEALYKKFWEDQLASLYYESLGRSKNKFVRDWAALNLNINNTLIALSCRRNGMEHTPYVVGNNEAAENLRTSNARDFGLVEIFEQFDQVRQIDEEPNLIEKEKKIDRLRWNWIDEENFFNYFTIEQVLGYLFKLQMIERWIPLDAESGNRIFKEMVEGLKKSGLNLKPFRLKKF